DDVAEFAGERAAARELDSDEEIILELQEVEARDRRFRDVGLELRRLVDAAAQAGPPAGDEAVDDAFRLAQDPQGGTSIDVRARRDVGTADSGRLTPRLNPIDDLQRVSLLSHHAA